MTINKFTAIGCALIGATMLQSCLKDQEDIFEESPSLRMQEMLDKTKTTLMKAPNGWVFDYFPDSRQQYGVFAYTVKFDDKEASVGAEVKPGEFSTSLYKLTDDSGPVLSFDTYNDLMHYFATPDSENPRAMDGDFEFVIMEVTDTLITLRGKRTGNDMYMRPLPYEASRYLEEVSAMANDIFLPDLTGSVDGTEVTGKVNADGRYMELSWAEGKSERAYYVPVPEGIRFVTPMEVNGSRINELAYSFRDLTFTNATTNLKYTVGPTYTIFEDYEGDYDLVYDNGNAAISVELVPDKANNCYYMKGLNPKYDVKVRYERTLGCLNITSQQIGTDLHDGWDEVLIWFTGKEFDGKYSVNTECGVYAIKDVDSPGTFNFSPNTYKTVHANSFYIAQIKSLLYEDDVDGDAPQSWQVNGDPMIPHIVCLRKK